MSPWLKDDGASSCDDDSAARANVNANANADAGANAYKLSAVVMHVGGPSAGHYYAYVRYREPAPLPQTRSGSAANSCSRPAAADSKTAGGRASASRQPPAATTSPEVWVKLDDHRVTKVSEAEVLRDAFGGGGGTYKGPGAELQGLFGQVTIHFSKLARCLVYF